MRMECHVQVGLSEWILSENMTLRKTTHMLLLRVSNVMYALFSFQYNFIMQVSRLYSFSGLS